MAGIMTTKSSDVLSYVLAVGLAAACITFAGYKVFKLRTMENIPADLGLNFPPPKRKMITDDGIEVDPLATQSITPVDGPASAGPIRQPYVNELPALSYRLITVVNGVAFIEIQTIRGKEILPAAAGARLRGAGTVRWIERRGGRWVVEAGDLTLVSGVTVAQ
jgi:hypothetical protein